MNRIMERVITGSSLISVIALILLCLAQIMACSPRDIALEEKFATKLSELKNSNERSMNLNDILGRSWRKACVQGPYEIVENFNKDTGEKINRLLDITENEIAIWVFYNDNSMRTAILEKEVMDFGVSKSKDGAPIICASKKYPTLYVRKTISRTFFYFNDR